MLKELELDKVSFKACFNSLNLLFNRNEINFSFSTFTTTTKTSKKSVLSKRAKKKIQKDFGKSQKNKQKIEEERKEVLYEYVKFLERMGNLLSKKISVEDHDKSDLLLLTNIIFQLFTKSKRFAEMLVHRIINTETYSVSFNKQVQFEQGNESNTVYPELWTDFSLIERDTEKSERLQKWIDHLNSSQVFMQLTEGKRFVANFFISNLFDFYYDNYVLKQNKKWHYLYKYNVFVNFVYDQVKGHKNIKEIDEILLNTVKSVLMNKIYINLFHSLLITKTNLNDEEQVDILLEFLANNLEMVKLSKSKHLLTFEFSLLIKVVTHILNNYYFINIEKCLLFLYKYTKTLGERFMMELWEKLIYTSRFFNLFLHWSFAVRKVFYFFLIFNYYDNMFFRQKIERLVKKIEIEGSAYKKCLKGMQKSARKKILNKIKFKKSKSLGKQSEINFKFKKRLRVYINEALIQFHTVEQAYKEWSGINDLVNVNKNINKDSGSFPSIDIRILKDGFESSLMKNFN